MPFCSQVLSSPTQLAEFADLERTVAWTTPEKQARREVFGTPELARRPCTVAKLHPCNVSCILCPDELRTSVSGKPRADIALCGSGMCSKGCQHAYDTTFTLEARQKVREQRHAAYFTSNTHSVCMGAD